MSEADPSLWPMSSVNGDDGRPRNAAVSAMPEPWQAFLAEICDAVADCPLGEQWQLTDDHLLQAVATIDSVQAALEATRLTLLAAIDERGLAADAGAASTTALLRDRLRLRPRDAARDVRLGRELATLCPPLQDALRQGTISKEHAGVVARIVRQFPEHLDLVERDEAIATLIDAATQFDPSDVSRIGTHLLAALDPDGPQPEHDERQGRARREFTWSRQDDGTVTLYGRLDAEGGAVLISAVGPLSAPRPCTDLEGPDPRTAAQRRADGLVELANRGLQAGDVPTEGGERAHIAVTVSLDTLMASVDDARARGGNELPIMDHTGPLSPTSARRLACDARIIPVVLGGEGQPLDVGRSQRLVTLPQRRALTARDRGCAFPGCDRPPTWCDAHHIVHWSDGGPTDLDNLVLVCRHHHRRIHHDGWQVTMGPSGFPEFSPPARPTLVVGRGPRPPRSRISAKADRWWRQRRGRPPSRQRAPDPSSPASTNESGYPRP